MSSLADNLSREEIADVFKLLKSQNKNNKVSRMTQEMREAIDWKHGQDIRATSPSLFDLNPSFFHPNLSYRSVLIAGPKIRHGRVLLMQSTSVWIARVFIETWAFTSLS